MKPNMKMNDYESPASEVVEIEAEQFFAGSGDGTGTGGDWPDFGDGGDGTGSGGDWPDFQ